MPEVSTVPMACPTTSGIGGPLIPLLHFSPCSISHHHSVIFHCVECSSLQILAVNSEIGFYGISGPSIPEEVTLAVACPTTSGIGGRQYHDFIFFLHSLWSSCISVSVRWISYYVQSSYSSHLGYRRAADTTFAHSLLCDYVWLASSCDCILSLHMFLVD